MARTAVAAPAQPPYEAMLEAIDAMTVLELLAFVLRVRLLVAARLGSD